MIKITDWKRPILSRALLLTLSLSLSLVLPVLSAPAHAQYMRELNKDKNTPELPSGQYNPEQGQGQNANAEGQSRALTYNPYIPKSVQSVPQEQATKNANNSTSASSSEPSQFDLGSALLEDFARKSVSNGLSSTELDRSAPRREDLVSLSALPNDAITYCEEYEANNPATKDLQAYMETFLHERIKPISQMNIITPKSCLRKVNEIAETMLVDYTDFKRNELILRAGQDPAAIADAARKANRLPEANTTYLVYARSECTLSRQSAAKSPLELNNLVEACVLQMLKRRIQQIADM
tara:strand:+ start:71672 stop:72556 length:885 start_codon:yes stop_codon:yes gene_type:complete